MEDCKDTPEGRAVQEKYGDILHMKRPAPSPRHPRMPVASRARLFSPFAALRGFDDELSAQEARRLENSLPPDDEADFFT